MAFSENDTNRQKRENMVSIQQEYPEDRGRFDSAVYVPFSRAFSSSTCCWPSEGAATAVDPCFSSPRRDDAAQFSFWLLLLLLPLSDFSPPRRRGDCDSSDDDNVVVPPPRPTLLRLAALVDDWDCDSPIDMSSRSSISESSSVSSSPPPNAASGSPFADDDSNGGSGSGSDAFDFDLDDEDDFTAFFFFRAGGCPARFFLFETGMVDILFLGFDFGCLLSRGYMGQEGRQGRRALY